MFQVHTPVKSNNQMVLIPQTANRKSISLKAGVPVEVAVTIEHDLVAWDYFERPPVTVDTNEAVRAIADTAVTRKSCYPHQILHEKM